MTTDNFLLKNGSRFECSNGGNIHIYGIEDDNEFERSGVEDEFAYYDDLFIDAYNDMTINVGSDNDTKASVRHITGDEIMRFQLSSLEPGGRADIKLTNLHSNSWYRLRFNGILAKCNGGRAHGRTNGHGILTFNKVKIPNE